jgi:hypothetical protein
VGIEYSGSMTGWSRRITIQDEHNFWDIKVNAETELALAQFIQKRLLELPRTGSHIRICLSLER